jgi:SiaC family regulatory phosphoprotein
MDDVYLDATRHTPQVDFRFSEHRLRLSGEAYPENAAAFFAPLIQACDSYLHEDGETPVVVDLSLRYLNSASTKLLFHFIAVFDKAASAGRKVVIAFEHDPEDEMLIEFAEDLALDFPSIEMKLVEMA